MAIVGFRKRPSAGFNFDASLTYQNSQGNIGNTVFTNWGHAGPFGQHDNPNYAGHPFTVGPLDYDRTWQFKLLTNYRLPGGILASTYLQGLSGRPMDAQDPGPRHGHQLQRPDDQFRRFGTEG